MRFVAEVREQPAALLRVLAQAGDVEAAARALVARRPAVVRLVGHGSSDAAAVYGGYAFGLLPGWTALRDSISLAVHYDAPVDLRASAVIALSQSGRTPDVIEYVERARARGALTIAVTNDDESELAAAAEVALALDAGEERAVAASKTYTATLATLALLAAGCAGRGSEMASGLARTASLLADVLDPVERAVGPVAHALGDVGRMYVIGRGVESATAREMALKLKETCRVAAEPLSATALVHGPVAALDPLFPVWAVVSRDPALASVAAACTRAAEAGATLVASGSAAGDIAEARWTLPLPAAPLPVLAPLLSVLPGQLFAARLAAVRGLDPDRPAGLTKVTLAS
jgi:glucosamine--fructose-6-phosphate aminotransferase (isomerizing)